VKGDRITRTQEAHTVVKSQPRLIQVPYRTVRYGITDFSSIQPYSFEGFHFSLSTTQCFGLSYGFVTPLFHSLPEINKLNPELLPQLRKEVANVIHRGLKSVRGVVVSFDLWMSRKT
jgi:hypothetical protein